MQVLAVGAMAVGSATSAFALDELARQHFADGEGEVSCALALLQDLVDQLGCRFLDLLVGDALYLQAPFVKEVERLGLD